MPRKKPDYEDWGSVHKWIPLLDYEYSDYFGFNYNQYSQYLDAVMNKIKPFKNSREIPKGYAFTSISDDLFQPLRMNIVTTNKIPITFDSGCSVAVTPNKEDLCGGIRSSC